MTQPPPAAINAPSVSPLTQHDIKVLLVDDQAMIGEAVRRMLPKNRLAFQTLSKLKIYAGSEHPHQAQQPELTELGIKD